MAGTVLIIRLHCAGKDFFNAMSRMRSASTLNVIRVPSIVFLFLSAPLMAAEPTGSPSAREPSTVKMSREQPAFLSSGAIESFGIHNWLVFEYMGDQDKPIPDDVIGFSSDTRAVGRESDVNSSSSPSPQDSDYPEIKIILPEKYFWPTRSRLEQARRQPRDKSEDTMYAVFLYSEKELVRSHSLSARQAKFFFMLFCAEIADDPLVRQDVQATCARRVRFAAEKDARRKSP